MNKFKNFCKKHKTELIVAGCFVGGVIIGGVLTKKYYGKNFVNRKGKNAITWTPRDSFIDLERVKEILDLNSDSLSTYAVVKDGEDGLDAYTCICLSKDVIIE